MILTYFVEEVEEDKKLPWQIYREMKNFMETKKFSLVILFNFP